MIAVLASRFDDELKDTVEKWNLKETIFLLTTDDLLNSKWSVFTHQASNVKFDRHNQGFDARDLRVMINLLPQVYDFELLSIQKRDRRYVSAELFAFLVWWLRALPCVVLNRPTAGCLNGPNWHLEQWKLAARRSDLPVLFSPRDSGSPKPLLIPTQELKSTLIVRGMTYGQLFPSECCQLALLAGTDFLEVFFRMEKGSWVFHNANLLPQITRAEIKGLIIDACEIIIDNHGTNLGVTGR